jgi:hypothetical protein
MALKAVVEKLEDVPAEFQSLYVEKNGKFEIQIEGMKTQADIDRLQTALVKERTDHKQTKDKFAPFAELDITEVQAKLDRIPELEVAAAGKLDDTKINEIVETRIKTRIAPIERERDKLKGVVAEKDQEITGFKQKDKQRNITSAIQTAARKAGVVDTAIDDAVILAERVFDVDDAGNVTVKDNVGYTPGVDPTVWFSELQPRRPHWWGGSTGGGAKGNDGSKANAGTNPFTFEAWNLTEQGKIVRENRQRAEQLAKSAGTTIGGPKPPKRK